MEKKKDFPAGTLIRPYRKVLLPPKMGARPARSVSQKGKDRDVDKTACNYSLFHVGGTISQGPRKGKRENHDFYSMDAGGVEHSIYNRKNGSGDVGGLRWRGVSAEGRKNKIEFFQKKC